MRTLSSLPRRSLTLLTVAAVAVTVLALAPAEQARQPQVASAPRLDSVAAQARASTPVRYPGDASSTTFRGAAFDTCTAPSLGAMRAWRSSRFRGLGIYVSGSERSCAQPELTRGWVRRVTRLGWRLLPIHLGRQAPCTTRTDSATIRRTVAGRQGADAADNAITRANALGIRPGSALYLDVENYNPSRARCRSAVLRFVSGWTRRLHRRGYLAGVYANLSSGAPQLARAYDTGRYLRPDALWIARWDRSPRLFGVSGIPNRYWRNHQRAKQYIGDHTETHGGVRINIDSNRVDAPVATVLRSFRNTKEGALAGRSGPGRRYRAVRSFGAGDRVQVLCQARGSSVRGSSVWDKLGSGVYVPDAHVSTPSQTGFSRRIPQCTYPRQVAGTTRVSLRRGPGPRTAERGRLPGGALAQVVCQRRGGTVGGNNVWHRVRSGAWISDRRLAATGESGLFPGVPRCPLPR
jgi:uncharacterized protein YraI